MTLPVSEENPVRVAKQFLHWAAQHGFRGGSRGGAKHCIVLSSGAKHVTEGCWHTRRIVGYALKHYDGWAEWEPIYREDGPPRRTIRVLVHLDRMDIDDGCMDRWANSMGASISPIPRTQAEFDAAIETLVKKSRKRVAATWPDSPAADEDTAT